MQATQELRAALDVFEENLYEFHEREALRAASAGPGTQAAEG